MFLQTTPAEWTKSEVEGVIRRLPLPKFRRVLDICCGPGRHARYLSKAGYDVTGIDRDANAIEAARSSVPDASFVVLDQRDLASLEGSYDAALILWQSFGYFDAPTNDQVLADIASLLRPGGRLLLDLYHPRHFDQRVGRITNTRNPRCRAITNRLEGNRLTSTIEYVDDTQELMDWELFESQGPPQG